MKFSSPQIAVLQSLPTMSVLQELNQALSIARTEPNDTISVWSSKFRLLQARPNPL